MALGREGWQVQALKADVWNGWLCRTWIPPPQTQLVPCRRASSREPAIRRSPSTEGYGSLPPVLPSYHQLSASSYGCLGSPHLHPEARRSNNNLSPRSLRARRVPSPPPSSFISPVLPGTPRLNSPALSPRVSPRTLQPSATGVSVPALASPRQASRLFGRPASFQALPAASPAPLLSPRSPRSPRRASSLAPSQLTRIRQVPASACLPAQIGLPTNSTGMPMHSGSEFADQHSISRRPCQTQACTANTPAETHGQAADSSVLSSLPVPALVRDAFSNTSPLPGASEQRATERKNRSTPRVIPPPPTPPRPTSLQPLPLTPPLSPQVSASPVPRPSPVPSLAGLVAFELGDLAPPVLAVDCLTAPIDEEQAFQEAARALAACERVRALAAEMRAPLACSFRRAGRAA